MLDTTIKIKTDHFDGPLALLLHLVQKEEMDIRQLDLKAITSQYLSYLATMKELNFDVAGDYLYLATTLVFLKSKICLTEEVQNEIKNLAGESDLGISSHSDLVKKLEELQHFQRMGQALWNLPKRGVEIFIKPKIKRKVIVDSILTPIDIENLTSIMIDFLKVSNNQVSLIQKDLISIKDKLLELKKYLVKGDRTDLRNILDVSEDKSKISTVITFIALLELARLKKISLFQNEDLGNIYVDVLNDLKNFDVNEADGFENELEMEENVEHSSDEDFPEEQNIHQ